jgi:hypothetical protein
LCEGQRAHVRDEVLVTRVKVSMIPEIWFPELNAKSQIMRTELLEKKK